ncbi:hypothetical protein AB1N83_004448 [Pleurotus pulmonarius]
MFATADIPVGHTRPETAGSSQTTLENTNYGAVDTLHSALPECSEGKIVSLKRVDLVMNSDSSTLSSYWSGSSTSSEDGHIKKITTGGITAFVTVQTGTVEAVRKLLRNRLKEDGRVIRNPEMVTQRLRLESVDEAFVNACKTACLKECHEQLQTLESLALEADRKRGSSVPEMGGKKAKRREKKMYSPLVR